MADDKVKIIFDTDIGSDIDDAVALAYLLSQPRCELLGITTVTGEPLKRAEMASAVCRTVGRDDIPIHSGCAQSMLIRMRQDKAPQADALGGWDRRTDFAPNTAIEFLRTTIRAHPGEITLLAVGPMTNLGVLFALDPEIPALLKDLVLMCGRFFTWMGGEWNAIGDPHATAIVYGNGQQARPPHHVSFGLDVTTQCTLPADECRQRFTAKVLKPVKDFAEVWFKHRPHITFHDPLAAACVFEPDICTYKQGFVRVPLADPTAGWTLFNEGSQDKAHTVARDVDSKRFFEHYFDLVKSAGSHRGCMDGGGGAAGGCPAPTRFPDRHDQAPASRPRPPAFDRFISVIRIPFDSYAGAAVCAAKRLASSEPWRRREQPRQADGAHELLGMRIPPSRLAGGLKGHHQTKRPQANARGRFAVRKNPVQKRRDSRPRDSNPEPQLYESCALPLS